MSHKPKILFATPVLQHPAAGGPYLRIENSIKALSRISDLYIYSRVGLENIGGITGLSFYQQYCKEFYFAPFTASENRYITFAKRVINFLSRKIAKDNIITPVGQESEKDFHDLLKVADTVQADFIWLGYGNISYPLLKYIKSNSAYKVVLDTDSVWSRFILRELPYAINAEEYQKIEKAGREKAEEERWGTQLADVTTAVSEVDADYYRSFAKHPTQIQLFSNVIDPANYQQVPPPANFKTPSIYLAGTFWVRSPMEDAARWVIQYVLPLLRQRIPNIHFYVIGNGSERELADINDEGITITGRLPSVLPYLCNVNVALVPLRFESGTRFKILEAGACGIPVVSTTLGTEGIPVTHGRNILIADDPETFAESIAQLIANRDLAMGVGESLKMLVRDKYSVVSLAQEGQSILKCLQSACFLSNVQR